MNKRTMYIIWSFVLNLETKVFGDNQHPKRCCGTSCQDALNPFNAVCPHSWNKALHLIKLKGIKCIKCTKPTKTHFTKSNTSFCPSRLRWNCGVIHTKIWTFWKKRRKHLQTYKMWPNQPKPISQNHTQVFVHQHWGEIVGNPHKNLNFLEEKKETPSNI